MPKGVANKRYTPEFKKLVIETMRTSQTRNGSPIKQELIEYMDYYNNHGIKAKRKGLPPAIHRQQALSAA